MKGLSKALAITLWPALAAAVLAFAQGDNVSGKWTATMERRGRTGNFVLDLQVAGNKLTGTLSDPPDRGCQSKMGKSKTIS